MRSNQTLKWIKEICVLSVAKSPGSHLYAWKQLHLFYLFEIVSNCIFGSFQHLPVAGDIFAFLPINDGPQVIEVTGFLSFLRDVASALYPASATQWLITLFIITSIVLFVILLILFTYYYIISSIISLFNILLIYWLLNILLFLLFYYFIDFIHLLLYYFINYFII